MSLRDRILAADDIGKEMIRARMRQLFKYGFKPWRTAPFTITTVKLITGQQSSNRAECRDLLIVPPVGG